MRILLDARTIQDHFPGIGRYVYNLAGALAPQLEGELLVVTQQAALNTRYDLSALARHPNLTLVPTAIPIFSARAQIALPRLIRSLRPDLVHFPYNVRPLRLGLPSLLTLYDAIPRRFPHYFSPFNRLGIELIQRLALAASGAFVAISQATARDFTAYYRVPPERITITPLAPDPIFHPQPLDAIAALRQRLSLPERYVLYLGSNKPHKNLPRLIEAWDMVISDFGIGISELLVAGAWDERYPQARQRAETLGLGDSVRFLGPVAGADLPALYAGAELFLFPSLYEGFGLPVLEAMACGVPVLCSNTSSLPEIAGDAALLFDPADVEAIAAALSRALRDASLRQELRSEGLARARQFTWASTARATLEAYRALLREREAG